MIESRKLKIGSLSKQQFRTLWGQAKAGDHDAALRGLEKILGRCADGVEKNRADRR